MQVHHLNFEDQSPHKVEPSDYSFSDELHACAVFEEKVRKLFQESWNRVVVVLSDHDWLKRPYFILTAKQLIKSKLPLAFSREGNTEECYTLQELFSQSATHTQHVHVPGY